MPVPPDLALPLTALLTALGAADLTRILSDLAELATEDGRARRVELTAERLASGQIDYELGVKRRTPKPAAA